MRKRIDKTVEIINGHQEIANLIIKGDPFKDLHSDLLQSSKTSETVKEVASDEEQDSIGHPNDDLHGGDRNGSSHRSMSSSSSSDSSLKNEIDAEKNFEQNIVATN